MAKLTFPPNPDANSEVTTGDITWKWNGYSWYAIAPEIEAGASVSIGENPPSDPVEGDMWYADSDSEEFGGRLYIYVENQWVDASLPGGGGGFTEADADALYLSKTTDDTAAGAITFEGRTTYKGGVYVLGDKLAVSGLASDDTNTNIRSIISNPNLSTVTSAQHVRLFDAFPGIEAANAQSLTGFRASNMLEGKATKVYGFYSVISSSFPDHYNFYANGDATNYFKGDLLISKSTDSVADVKSGSTNGKYIDSAIFYSTRDGTDSQTHVMFRNANGQCGSIVTNSSNIRINGLAGGPLLRNGNDLDTSEGIIAAVANVVDRINALEANEIIDDATDTSLLQLLANASSRLNSIEVRLSALEGA